MLKTLIDRKLIATAGRKQVVGKPIVYKTTREFLVQFGLRDLSELPTLKEFQEIGRMDTETPSQPVPPADTPEPLPPIDDPQPKPPISEPTPPPGEESPGKELPGDRSPSGEETPGRDNSIEG